MSSGEPSWRDELTSGLRWISQGRFSQALACLHRAYEIAPDRAETACALGREELRRGNTAAAEPLLRKAWKIDNTLTSAGLTLARCLGIRMREFSEAHEIIDHLLASNPEDIGAALVRSELYLAEGRFENADRCVQEIRPNSDKHDGTLRLLQARIENERGLREVSGENFEMALFSFKRANALDPGWGAPICNMGSAFEKLGKRAAAEAQYHEACRVEPNYAAAWHNLATLYDREGDTRALEFYERAYLVDASQIELVADYASALFAAGEVELSQEILQIHSDAFLENGSAWAQLAVPLARRGNFVLVEFCLEQAKKNCPDPSVQDRVRQILDKRNNWRDLPAT